MGTFSFKGKKAYKLILEAVVRISLRVSGFHNFLDGGVVLCGRSAGGVSALWELCRKRRGMGRMEGGNERRNGMKRAYGAVRVFRIKI